MPYAEECERPFYVEPNVLLKANFLPSIACASNAINSLMRGTLLIILICAMVSSIYGPSIFVFGIVIISALYGPSLYATLIGGISEGFKASLIRDEPIVSYSKEDIIGSDADADVDTNANYSSSTKPTAKNPFMNVLINEIKYNPSRPPAQDINNSAIKTQLDDFFRFSWVADPTDVFGRSQSQREFYTMPSTSIPNDQASYQDWLYKIPGKTCKEGGREACLPGTGGGPITWLNSDR